VYSKRPALGTLKQQQKLYSEKDIWGLLHTLTSSQIIEYKELLHSVISAGALQNLVNGITNKM
jgi:hypothetical protein